jgi:hypothetical protein
MASKVTEGTTRVTPDRPRKLVLIDAKTLAEGHDAGEFQENPPRGRGI